MVRGDGERRCIKESMRRCGVVGGMKGCIKSSAKWSGVEWSEVVWSIVVCGDVEWSEVVWSIVV